MAKRTRRLEPRPDPDQLDMFPGTHPSPPAPPPAPPAPPPVVTPPGAPHVPYGTRVDYRYDEAAQLALEHRAVNGITGQQNVAVMVYRDLQGVERTLVIESGEPLSPQALALSAALESRGEGRGHGHSESKLRAFLDINTIPYDHVVSIFSEREPCTTSPCCAELLRRMRVGPEKVTYSFEYGPTRDSRDRGNARLTEVVTALLRARNGLPMPASRDPRADDY